MSSCPTPLPYIPLPVIGHFKLGQIYCEIRRKIFSYCHRLSVIYLAMCEVNTCSKFNTNFPSGDPMFLACSFLVIHVILDGDCFIICYVFLTSHTGVPYRRSTNFRLVMLALLCTGAKKKDRHSITRRFKPLLSKPE